MHSCFDKVFTLRQTQPCFDTDTLPEAEMLEIHNSFRDLAFKQQPRPWKVARESTNEVSGTKLIAFLITGWG